MSDSTQAATDLLGRLDALLAEEDIALRKLDVGAIASITEAKEDLERRIASELTSAGPIDAAQRAALLALRDRVRTRGEANLRRLRTTLRTVESLVGALTGDPQPSYGRRRSSPAYGPTTTRAVITEEVG